MSEWDSPDRTFDIEKAERSMNSDVRDLWVEALRSGIYTKGKYKLRVDGEDGSSDRYCAMGVLCSIADLLDIYKWDKLHDEWMMLGRNNILPHPIHDWAGITMTHPSHGLVLEVGGKEVPIWYLNDSIDMSFEDIATLIGAQY